MKSDNEFRRGLIDGIPIGLAYVAVSFAFGISGASKGIPVWALTLISATCVTSAGQFAAIITMTAGGSLVELVLSQIIINLRYSIMSIAIFDAERIPKIRRMILSTTKEAREIALNQLIPYQKKDFKDLYEVMEGRPVTIRFLDPPLHEFLPNTMEEITALAKDMGVTVEEINMRRAALHEFNPMMGHRGCRLAVTYPEIAKMQTRAVMEAAIEVKQEKGYDIVPEIMIPLVGEKKELAYVKEVVVQTAEKVKAYYESDIKYKVGTMIEIPRAALLADEIAEEAEFFSFGTNDLTQMTFGFSRDDAGKFLESYYENKIYESDPFAKLDQKGVGQLIEMAAKKGKATRPDIHLGICGEHGGDPSSVEFCYRAGLDYVSCSPFRVPIARLAAAQAVLKDK